MFISPISSVSTNAYRKTQFKKVQHNEKPQPQPQQPAFKGGNGGLLGGSVGTAGTLLALGLTAITGGLALPAILATPLIVAGGAGGAYLGDKIEDKIKGKSDKND